ncbi:UDP-glycosyltransferase 73C1 [Linum perenne]
MAQGHLIPMIDIAKLLAQHDVVVTVITTPVNADRVRSTLTRAINSSGAQISVKEVEFPCEKLGLPKSCENLDQLPSLGLAGNFMDKGDKFLQRAVEKIFKELRPMPNCIISDMSFPYTSFLAQEYGIPRISFNGVTSDFESFSVPGMPHQVELTKAKLPFDMIKGLDQFNERFEAAEALSYGTIFNSFEELERDCFSVFKETTGKKAWCVGPVSLGNRNSTDGLKCLEWLDLQESGSVVYVCLGSICNISTSQLIELGLGLEASNRSFMWVIRDANNTNELMKWMQEYDFEERIKEQGFIIRGWAPQVEILSHFAIGGFLTHCFCNERLVVDVLKIGVEIGEEEKHGVQVRKERIKEAVEELMGGGEESEIRRRKAEELKALAVAAVGEGGSSFKSVGMLIEDVTKFGGDC